MLPFYSVRFNTQLSFLILFGLFFCSCGQYLYTPAAGTIPNLQKKGELKAQGSLGGQNPSFGSSASVAYAGTEHIGLTAKAAVSGAFRFNSVLSNAEYRLVGNGYYAEIGTGRFGFLPQHHNKTEGISLMLFGGLGTGGFSARILGDFGENVIADKAKLHYNMAYLQPAAILRHPWFSLGVSTRIGYVHFQKGAFWGDKQMFRPTFQFFQRQKSFMVVEPTLQLWARSWRGTKFHIFLTATSMPVEVATTTVWGIGAQMPLGG